MKITRQQAIENGYKPVDSLKANIYNSFRKRRGQKPIPRGKFNNPPEALKQAKEGI